MIMKLDISNFNESKPGSKYSSMIYSINPTITHISQNSLKYLF